MGDPASEQFSLRWNNFYTNLTLGFHALLQGEDLVDVTIAVDGKFVQAHKIVLSVCSPYFKDLFKVNPCKHPIVILKDVGYKELSGLLQFMYKGEVNVCQEELADFLKTAELLQIKGLTSSEAQDSPKSRKRSITPELKKRSTPSSLQNQLKRKRMDATDIHRPSSPNVDNLARVDSKPSLLPPVPKMEPIDYSEGEDYETQETNSDLLSNIVAGETSRPVSATQKQGQRMFANFSQDLTDGTQAGFRITSRGRLQLVQNGYVYHCNRQTENKIFWKCAEYNKTGCRGRCISIGSQITVTHAFHNHGVRADTIRDDAESVTDPSLLTSNFSYSDIHKENTGTSTG